MNFTYLHTRRHIRLVLLICTACLALAACSPGSNTSFHVSEGAMASNRQNPNMDTVITHVYIQATVNMATGNKAVVLGPDYNRALELLVGNSRTGVRYAAASIWGTGGAQRVYRSDILWIEPQRDFIAYGRGRAFAYPLDPSFWQTPRRDFQILQIFHSNFYQLNWYEYNIYDRVQYGRAPDLYYTWISGPRPEHQEFSISGTIAEISTLRDGSDEVSVLVTNFIGRNQSEERNIDRYILDYLQDGDSRAIAFFSFANRLENGEKRPFHFILFGNERRVIELADYLGRQFMQSEIEVEQSPVFRREGMLAGSGVNGATNMGDITITDTRGTRRAFNRDFTQETINYFADNGFGSDEITWRVFNIWPQLLEDAQFARVSIMMDLEEIQQLREQSIDSFGYRLNVYLAGNAEPAPIVSGRTRVDFRQDESGKIIADLHLYRGIFQGENQAVRVALEIYINDVLQREDIATIGHPEFISTFTQLANIIQGGQQAGNEMLLQTRIIDDLELYFIKN